MHQPQDPSVHGIELARKTALVRHLWIDVLIIALPALQFLQFHIVGTLYATELLLLVVFPYALLSRKGILSKPLPRTFFGLGALWLLGQMLTDIVRSTPFHDYARGWAMIVFTLTNFSGLYILLSSSVRVMFLYAFGAAVGTILTYYLTPVSYAGAYPWEFGYGFGVTVLMVLVANGAAGRSRRKTSAFVLFVTSALNLYNGFRSQAGACFVAGIYLLTDKLFGTRSTERGYSRVFSRLATYVIVALSLLTFFRVYSYCAQNGMLGYVAWEKYESQSSGRYGLLVGGRSQFWVGLEAALESPVIGHGSWAQDWRYAARDADMMRELGYKVLSVPAAESSWVIPSHSYIIGAWVNAGISGAIFWLWVLSLPIRVLLRVDSAATESTRPLVAFFAVTLIWNVLFSPYGADQRLLAPFFAAAMILALENSDALRTAVYSFNPATLIPPRELRVAPN